MIKGPRVSIIIPTYNEEQKVVDNVNRLATALSSADFSYEVIFVNDGSIDNTKGLLAGIVAKHKGFRYVSYDKNRGRGFALRTGFMAAKGEFIISTESDFNWGTNVIFEIYRALQEPFTDMVIVSPQLTADGYQNVPFFRRFLAKAGNKAFSFLISRKITMFTGMTRGYRADVIKALDLENDGKEIHVEIITKALANGYRISEIPGRITWKPGARKSNFKSSKLIKTHLLLGISEAPLLILVSIGCLFVFIGVGLFVYLLYLYLTLGNLANRPSLILALVFLTVGLQVLVSSVLAMQNVMLRKELTRLTRIVLTGQKQS